jgi:hypothetical protein
MRHDLLKEEHRLLRQTVLAFARRELAPVADEIESIGTTPYRQTSFCAWGRSAFWGSPFRKSTAGLAPISSPVCWRLSS